MHNIPTKVSSASSTLVSDESRRPDDVGLSQSGSHPDSGVRVTVLPSAQTQASFLQSIQQNHNNNYDLDRRLNDIRKSESAPVMIQNMFLKPASPEETENWGADFAASSEGDVGHNANWTSKWKISASPAQPDLRNPKENNLDQGAQIIHSPGSSGLLPNIPLLFDERPGGDPGAETSGQRRHRSAREKRYANVLDKRRRGGLPGNQGRTLSASHLTIKNNRGQAPKDKSPPLSPEMQQRINSGGLLNLGQSNNVILTSNPEESSVRPDPKSRSGSPSPELKRNTRSKVGDASSPGRHIRKDRADYSFLLEKRADRGGRKGKELRTSNQEEPSGSGISLKPKKADPDRLRELRKKFSTSSIFSRKKHGDGAKRKDKPDPREKKQPGDVRKGEFDLSKTEEFELPLFLTEGQRAEVEKKVLFAAALILTNDVRVGFDETTLMAAVFNHILSKLTCFEDFEKMDYVTEIEKFLRDWA
jgi:hypothetical protein